MRRINDADMLASDHGAFALQQVAHQPATGSGMVNDRPPTTPTKTTTRQPTTYTLTKISLEHFDHEYCHAQCAYQFSPYREALVLTMDGLGDDGVFSRAYVGKAGRLLPIAYSASAYRISSNGPHGRFSNPCSLGGIFTYFTCLLGFKPNCDEGKVEALAAFGRCLPTLHDALIKATKINSSTHAIDLDEEQLSRIFAACDVLTPNDTMRADIAATAQLFAEEILISYIKHLLALTGTRAVCLSGGVFANVLVNMRVAALVENRLYVAPAMGDEGSAQGAAVAMMIETAGETGDSAWLRDHTMPYFGLAYQRSQVIAALDRCSDQLDFCDVGECLSREVARRIFDGQIGALFQGRSEFGPRALGNRSILANPMKSESNEVVA